MFDAFKDFLRNLSGAPTGRLGGEDDPLVAASALLFHVAEADGTLTQSETDALRDVLPDPAARHAYVSGSPSFVQRARGVLRAAGVRRIRTDAFSGY